MRLNSPSKFYVQFHLLVLACFAFLVLTCVSPHVFPRPNIDQGIYTYIGNGILEGKTPYRDLWDHKGVVIYYIYALGLLIDSGYGVWLVGLITLWITVGISYKFYYDLFGLSEAFVWTLTWLTGLQFVLDGGNTIEYFNLPLSFGSLFCVFLLLRSHKLSFAILIGCLGGVSFFLRPNEIGILLAACLLCFFQIATNIHKSKFFLKGFVFVGGGFLLTTSLFLLKLHFQGSSNAFYDAFIRFNLLYIGINSNKFAALFFGIYLLPIIFIFSFTAWILLIIGMLQKFRRYPKTGPYAPALLLDSPGSSRDLQLIGIRWGGTYIDEKFAVFLIIAFPLLILLSIMSGRAYAHYFTSWLPVMSLMTALGVKPLQDMLCKASLRYTKLAWVGLSLSLIIFSAARLHTPLASFVSALVKTGSFPAIDIKNNPEREYVTYIVQHSLETDSVWLWGTQVVFNIQSDRKAPSRFIYPYPFGVSDYATAQLVTEAINDLKTHNPALIIDPAQDYLPSLNYAGWADDRVVWPLVDYIRAHYHVIDYLGPEQWAVWVPN